MSRAQLDSLLSIFGRHRVSRHTVFTTLAARKVSESQLRQYFVQMGAFCAASRQAGALVEALASKHPRVADLVEQILTSEAGHGADFTQMARALLPNLPQWASFDSVHACCISGDIDPVTAKCVAMFADRQLNGWGDLAINSPKRLYSPLGVMLVVEIAAHRQIIPGEVAAFIDSRFYGLRLEDMPYLAEHAGEHGAEHDHEEKIFEAIRLLPDGERILQALCQGVRGFCDALADFYDRLEAIVR